ncbi:tetratricopeptide repeat protein [Xylophilus sp. Leaf220]|uniref:tetratricopeptide repeat protein n=1 Tax=Xylophilus sp. Leaf220 TaxID=1735686 RepID=UPI0009EC452F|nr:tetratricopeptide repeat protein [Xylophilus sp. Leaf220]
MTRSTLSAARLLPVMALLCVLCIAPARAAEADDAEALLRNGRNAEALAKADAFLQNRPRDAQMRFVKARAQSALGRRAAALATLRDLTQDYPTLPEPLNNLAALQAAGGEWDAALLSLEAALRLKPDYAIAYENLGDVYMALAKKSYARTLALDPGNGSLRARLARITPAPPPAAAAPVAAPAVVPDAAGAQNARPAATGTPTPAASSLPGDTTGTEPAATTDPLRPASAATPESATAMPETDPSESGAEPPQNGAETTPVSPTSVAPASLLPGLTESTTLPLR